MGQTEIDAESFDPQGRRLCGDGACIGVIGPDGRCKVCSRPDDGGSQESFGAVGLSDDDDDEDGAMAAEPDDGAGFDPGRKLCVEGSCIGVIGPDGRCGVCGRSAEG
jgi:hypothetical protein